jgi:hypothetical protein
VELQPNEDVAKEEVAAAEEEATKTKMLPLSKITKRPEIMLLPRHLAVVAEEARVENEEEAVVVEEVEASRHLHA